MSGNDIFRDSKLHIPGSWPSAESGPVERVINIVELCEQILEYLPCSDLNRARRVCRQFNAVIYQSKVMQLRSSLRLRPNEIIWASPSNDTLLTGIYAEDYVAAARAEGRDTREFPVHEMHPFLKVDHGTSYIGHRIGSGPGWIWGTGNHHFNFGDLCLTRIPDHFALDDAHIPQPPKKSILVSMYRTHGEELFIDNDDGITFGDVRRAMENYLSDERNDPGVPWQPCKCTTVDTVHNRRDYTRWTAKSKTGETYNHELIFLGWLGILLLMG